MNNPEQITNLLTTIIIIMLGILFFLIVVLILVKINENKKNKKIQKEELIHDKINNDENQKKIKRKIVEYSEKPINDFMEFNQIVDNMIEQKKKQKYLMLIKCQGINYDLMSGLEKNSVEKGFIEFLNMLRYPIQIYIQTRKVNLDRSIEKYQKRLNQIQSMYEIQKNKYFNIVNSDISSEDEISKIWYELTKQTNLMEYSKDLIENTQRMSLNNNVLRKDYYIVIPYYPSELGNNDYDLSEIRNLAFSELYTRAQSIISGLLSCGIQGRVLSSEEIMEVLYSSYNRDDADALSVEKAIQSGYNEMYVTAPDVLEKRMQEIEKEINRKAWDIINDSISKLDEKKEREVKEKENNIALLAREMAKVIVNNNKMNIGIKKTQKVLDEIEEGGKIENDKEKNSRKRK